MRILLVSDLHYSLPQFDWVVAAGASFDVVVVAGDSLNINSTVPLDAQSVVVHRYLDLIASETQLVVSSGNHDLTGPDTAGEQSALWLHELHGELRTDGESLSLDDTLITICPWWDGPLGRADVVAQLTADAARRTANWVWVYHWPPLGSPTCWTGRRDYGDADLREWIEQFQPEIVLAGHVHESPFKSDGSWNDRIGNTWVFNAGHQIGKVPAFMELDLLLQQARWVSIMGTEAVDLHDEMAPARTVFDADQ
jgi:Icc-related predicted phosphoesterase